MSKKSAHTAGVQHFSNKTQWGTFPSQEALATGPCDVLAAQRTQCSFRIRDCDVSLQSTGPSKVYHLQSFHKVPRVRLLFKLIL